MKRLEIKNYKVFPSREWGPEGGSCCDIYLDDEIIGDYFNAGDGGEPDISIPTNINIACLNMIKTKYKNLIHPETYKYLNGIECVLEVVDVLNKSEAKMEQLPKDKVLWVISAGGWNDYIGYPKDFPEDAVRKHYGHLKNKSNFDFVSVKIESKEHIKKLREFMIEV